MTPRRRRTADGTVADLVLVLTIRHPGWTAAQILNEIQRQHVGPEGSLPSLRTVQRYMAQVQPSGSEPGAELWSLLDGSPDDAALISGMLLDFSFIRGMMPIRDGDGPSRLASRRPTRLQADLILRIRRVGPDLAGPAVAWLALLGSSSDRGREYLEDYLACTPWRDDSATWTWAKKWGFVDSSMLDFAEVAKVFSGVRVPPSTVRPRPRELGEDRGTEIPLTSILNASEVLTSLSEEANDER
jgi:hypothetical protein